MSGRLSSQDMADELSKLLYGKHDWLSKFADGKNKRPAHDVERVRYELTVLTQAAHDYRRAAQRDKDAA